MRSTRKLRIKISESDLLLGFLGISVPESDKELDFTIEVPETKELYKSLTENTKIKDWDFIDDEVEEVKPAPKYQAVGEEKTPEEDLAICATRDLDIVGFNELAYFLEALLIVGYKSPALKFDKYLFSHQLKDKLEELRKIPITAEHAVCKMVLETNYLRLSCYEALIDVIIKMKEIWMKKEIKNYPTLASLLSKLFKTV